MHPDVERSSPHLKELRQDVAALLRIRIHLKLRRRKRVGQQGLVAGRIRPVPLLPRPPMNESPEARQAEQSETLPQRPGANLGELLSRKRLGRWVYRLDFGARTRRFLLVSHSARLLPQFVRHPVVQRAVAPGGEWPARHEAVDAQVDLGGGAIGKLRADTAGQPDRKAHRKPPDQWAQSREGALAIHFGALRVNDQSSQFIRIIRSRRRFRVWHRVGSQEPEQRRRTMRRPANARTKPRQQADCLVGSRSVSGRSTSFVRCSLHPPSRKKGPVVLPPSFASLQPTSLAPAGASGSRSPGRGGRGARPAARCLPA